MIERCYKLLAEGRNEQVSYIITRLIGLMKGNSKADPASCEFFFKNHDGFIYSLNRINYTAQPQKTVMAILEELLTKVAPALGIVKMNGGEAQASDKEFPREIIDFLHFYKMLVVVCKIAIAKHDDLRIRAKIAKDDEIFNQNLLQIEMLNS